MSSISDPREIEKKSFEIIEGLIGDVWQGPERDIVARVVHATADPDFKDSLVFSEGAVDAGVKAVRSGCPVVTDVNMLRAGISAGYPGGPENITCLIAGPDVAESAKRSGRTRSAEAMKKAAGAGKMSGAVVAVGNAPTALYEVMRLVREEGIRPALVVGVPVGFVGAAESKEELLSLKEVPYITNRGRKGGSPVAAAIINALVKLASKP